MGFSYCTFQGTLSKRRRELKQFCGLDNKDRGGQSVSTWSSSALLIDTVMPKRDWGSEGPLGLRVHSGWVAHPLPHPGTLDPGLLEVNAFSHSALSEDQEAFLWGKIQKIWKAPTWEVFISVCKGGGWVNDSPQGCERLFYRRWLWALLHWLSRKQRKGMRENGSTGDLESR